MHCVKSVRIRSFSGPYFPTLELNTQRYSDQKSSGYGHFSRSDSLKHPLSVAAFRKQIMEASYRSIHPEAFCKKGALENLAKVTGEFCEIFKNTFFKRHHWTTASKL